MSFSFGFGGDDIEEDTVVDDGPTLLPPTSSQAAETGTLRRTPISISGTTTTTTTAFPTGQNLLPARSHPLSDLLAALPERISYSTLSIKLDSVSETGNNIIRIPRRELWDVRVQIMAETSDEDLAAGTGDEGLGKEDVKTGVYEGGFKSWECSVDLVRVLASRLSLQPQPRPPQDAQYEYRRQQPQADISRVLEMGCGTALPTLALLQWKLQANQPLVTTLADYNPSVLRLVTVPNLLLSWSLAQANLQGIAFEEEGELEITPQLLEQFQTDLDNRGCRLTFLSGAWSAEFLSLFAGVSTSQPESRGQLLILAAETIYSPAALTSFGTTLMGILEGERDDATALVGAKQVYFGVGGTMEDFCGLVQSYGGHIQQVQQEEDGIRRTVVEVAAKKDSGMAK